MLCDVTFTGVENVELVQRVLGFRVWVSGLGNQNTNTLLHPCQGTEGSISTGESQFDGSTYPHGGFSNVYEES